MTSHISFVLDNEWYLTNQKCFIMTWENIEYICEQLNKNYMKLYYTWVLAKLWSDWYELSKIFMENIPVIKEHYSIEFTDEEMNFISSSVNSIDS